MTQTDISQDAVTRHTELMLKCNLIEAVKCMDALAARLSKVEAEADLEKAREVLEVVADGHTKGYSDNHKLSHQALAATEYDYRTALRVMTGCACKVCGGSGERNDDDPGDISFNSWVCQACDGKGWDRHAYAEAFPSHTPEGSVAAAQQAFNAAAVEVLHYGATIARLHSLRNTWEALRALAGEDV